MEIGDLIEIGEEIRNRIKGFIEKNPDYAEKVTNLKLKKKLQAKNPTHMMDIEAEYALDDALENRGLSAKIISEEFVERNVPDHVVADFMLVFDPIDGSTNAAHRIPFYCTSLAYTEKTESATFDDISMAVICDIRGNTYHAERGKGAFVNGKKIISGKRILKDYVVSVLSYGVKDVPRGLIEFEKSEKIKIRTLGSIALEMCYVADGTLDGVIDTRGLVSGYDIMASALVLKEAGGLLCDLRGKPVTDNDVKATGMSIIGTKNMELHDRIVKTLAL